MFDWADLLALAERLAARDTDEAELRTAIRRAHYAAYHRASAFVRANDLVPARSRRSHQRVWEAFAVTNDPRHTEVVIRGDFLRRLRTSADYHYPFPGGIADASRFAVTEARSMLEVLDRL